MVLRDGGACQNNARAILTNSRPPGAGQGSQASDPELLTRKSSNEVIDLNR